MKKVGIIIKREYFTRVKNKTFLLSTFLLPIVMVLFIAGSIFISSKGSGNYIIAFNDESGVFKNVIKGKDDNSIQFAFTNDTSATTILSSKYDAFIHVKKMNDLEKNTISIQVKKQLSISAEEFITREMNKALENKMLQENFNIASATLDSMRNNARSIELKQLQANGTEQKQIYSALSSSIGFFCGILIYITMFIYGAQVMRGVMEEKTNRIAEVVVSSVKPFQLMLGKILGIGAVGLTQFILWIVLLLGITTLAQLFIPSDIMMQVQQLQSNPGLQASNGVEFSKAAQNIASAKEALNSLNWPLILGAFLFYFLGGYLFYSALFAAVGSVINEDPQEAQSLMLPITMPIIFGFIIMAQAAQNPNTSLAFWGSIIPFTSPIVMMGIVPSEGVVSWWQLALSVSLLIIGFLLTTWLAAKIYRTGILMYGKKATWKEMIKWTFRKS